MSFPSLEIPLKIRPPPLSIFFPGSSKELLMGQIKIRNILILFVLNHIEVIIRPHWKAP